MRLPDLLIGGIGPDFENGTRLLRRHAAFGACPAAPSPGGALLILGPIAPPGDPPIEIGLHEGGFFHAVSLELLIELDRLPVAQRRQRPAGEPAGEALPVHMAAVVVELHFEAVGPHMRGLSRRLLRGAKDAAETA